MKRILSLFLALVASTAFGAAVQIPQRNASGGGYDVKGVTDASSACTGCVGEELKQTRLTSAEVSLTNATGANVTASPVVLTAGDWDVSGMVTFDGSSVTCTGIYASVSSVSATVPNGDTQGVSDSSGNVRVNIPVSSFSTTAWVVPIPPYRVSVANGATQTLYLVAQSNFSAGTVKVAGMIRARRIR